MATDKYEGEVCYVGHDHEAADGHILKGGWHYTVVEGPDGTDMPGEPLFRLKDSWRIAKDGDQSHHELHHTRLAVIAPDGQVGEPRTDEEREAVFRHLDDLQERVKKDELDEHEAGHVLTTEEEINVTRMWLQ